MARLNLRNTAPALDPTSNNTVANSMLLILEIVERYFRID